MSDEQPVKTTVNHYTPRDGDAQVIVDTAIATVEPEVLEPDDLYGVLIPAGAQHKVLDLETYGSAPRRMKGSVRLHTVDDLVRYVARHDNAEATTVWLDVEGNGIVAVLNDHRNDGLPEWGDHRATLQLKPTDEWEHWLSQDGDLLAQQAFADHIDDGLKEIVNPDPATMLEIAQSIQGATNVEFQAASRLDNGAIGVKYVEQTTARAGQRGDIEIPERFELAISPFLGEEPYKVGARLRYRLNSGQLSLGYKLDRPGDVVRDAIDQIAQRLSTTFTGDRVFIGVPRS